MPYSTYTIYHNSAGINEYYLFVHLIVSIFLVAIEVSVLVIRTVSPVVVVVISEVLTVVWSVVFTTLTFCLSFS